MSLSLPAQLLEEKGLPVPGRSPDPKIVIQNSREVAAV
jgi:hypothetical protein